MAPSHAKGRLTEGPIGPALSRLAVPMGLGIVFLVLLNLVDTYFVGQLGTSELAAMSFTFPIITLVISVTMGLSVGTTSAVSRAFGAGDDATVRKLTTHALLLAGVVVAVVSSVGVLTQDWVFTALGAQPALLPLLRQYMTIWFFGSVFLVVPMVANGVLRAGGDARTPMLMMMLAAIVNGILDPILIFGWGGAPRLGLTGAALATLAARAITLIIAIAILWRRNLLIVHWPQRRDVAQSWRAIVSVGVPAAISNALAPIATAVMTALIARHGHEAVAAYGVGSRLEGLLLIAPFALTAALTPFIGQNWGAHKTDRVAQGLRLSNRFVLAWGTGAWLLLLPFAGWVGQRFTDDPTVVDHVRDYLWIVPVSYGASGVVSVTTAAFNAIDRAVRSTALSAAKSLALAVPLAWMGAEWGQTRGLFAGIAIATVVTGVLAARWLSTLTHPQTGVHAPEEAHARLRGASAGLRGWVATLCDALARDAALEIRPRPINTIGFFAHGRELGHIHRNGHLDLHVPPDVHDALVTAKLAKHHRHRHEAGWISHRVSSESDVHEAAWLVRLTLALCRVAQSGSAAGGMEAHDLLHDPLVSEHPNLVAFLTQRLGLSPRTEEAPV